MITENLNLQLLKNILIPEPILIMNYKEMAERVEYLKSLKLAIDSDLFEEQDNDSN